MTHRLTRRACLVGTAFASLEAASLALGCDVATTGTRFVLESQVTSDVTTDAVVSALDGWEVSLSRAEIGLSTLLYLEGAPVARRWALMRSAHAHPGHYQGGTVLGESHTRAVVDLLGGPFSLGVSEAVSGIARSVTLGFLDRDDTPVALVEGVARRDGDEDRVFVARAFTADLLSTATSLPEVSGCRLDDGELLGEGVVTLEVQVRRWLDQIDFSEVVAQPEPYRLAEGEPATNAFLRGVRKAAAYAFTYRPS